MSHNNLKSTKVLWFEYNIDTEWHLPWFSLLKVGSEVQ